ncbi:MAG TPA: hypothetical protein VEK86_03540 [Gemmatimonadales bacterium]|nr:hypothetical protein [Gemmatimonadales bacterium]
MMRIAWIGLAVALCAPIMLTAQSDSVARRHDATLPDMQRATWRRVTVHYGKWLSAGTAVGLTVMAAHEHGRSRREWNQLLAICRSADDACARGPDGRYARADAEALYQRSLAYDRRANHRLLGAQASLLVTAALFILDLHPGRDEPDNIPFAPVRVTVEPTRDGAAVGLRLTL